MNKPTTLGELKQTEWGSDARIRRTVKDEMRENLICLLENGSPLFPGILGYERSEEHTSELQSRLHLVCRLLLEKKKKNKLHTVKSIISTRPRRSFAWCLSRYRD